MSASGAGVGTTAETFPEVRPAGDIIRTPAAGTALVTGASGGIGRAVAVALAKRNYRLVLSGRSLDRLDEAVARCVGSADAVAWPGDLTAPGFLGGLRCAVEHRFPLGLDLLVHCAAVFLGGRIEEIDCEALRGIVEINILATFSLLQAFAPIMRRGSTVVLLNSTKGVAATAGTAPYAATKHALRAIADSFRAEVNPRGIRVTSLFCGKTATEMQRRIYEGCGESEHYNEIENEILRPEDVAEIIVTTASLPWTAEITELCVRPSRKT